MNAAIARYRAWPASWGLATRMTLTMLGLLAALLLIVVLTHERATNERRAAEIANSVSTGNSVAGMIDEFGRSLETTALALSFTAAQATTIDQTTLGPTLASVSREIDLARGPFIFVTDVNGRVLASANGGSLGLDLSQRPYMQALSRGAPTVWGPTVAGVVSGGATLTYGRTVQTPSGQLRGYLVIAFYPSDLAARFHDRIPDDANVTIIDREGRALYSSLYPNIPADQRELASRPEVVAALGGSITRIDDAPGLFDAAPSFGVVVPISGTGWAVAFTRPRAPLEAILWQRLFTQAGEVTAAVAVVAVVMAIAARRIGRPLRQLAATAGAVARGERHPQPAGGGGREVAELGNAIEVMSSAVASREASLRRELTRRHILAETSAAFAAAGTDLQEELGTVARLVAFHVGEGCNLFLLSSNGLWLVPAAVYHPDAEVRKQTEAWLAAVPVIVSESLAGLAVQSGVPLVLADIVEEGVPLVGAQRVEHFRRIGAKGFAAARIASSGRIVGAIAVWRTTPDPYSDDDIALLQEIANGAGVSIESAQLIDEVREHAATAERAMQVQEEFAAQVAHDLLNPLAAIAAIGQTTLRRLRRAAPIDREQLEADMRALESAAMKAAREVNASLDVAREHAMRAPSLDLGQADLVEIVEEAVDQVRHVSASHRFVIRTAHDFIVGSWDRARLSRALDNMLGNAIKYSPGGGTVTVSLRAEMDPRSGRAVIEIADEGIGIPGAALPRVFDRFYRAENAMDIAGTGLGLNGVKQVVEAHGGSIEVRSVEGEGSVFTVRLPLSVPSSTTEDASMKDAPTA